MKIYESGIEHWYAFFIKDDKKWLDWPVYDRTFSGASDALRWLDKQEEGNALVMCNELPEDYWY